LKRKSITKKLRFEVFKRDLFKCQYCGNHPPEIVLEIDHIKPVSKGGTNDIENLITSCFDCNRGKSDKELKVCPGTLSKKIEKQKELQSQLKAYDRLIKANAKRKEEEMEELGMYWFNSWKEEKDKYVFGSSRRPSIRNFLKKISKYDLFEYMDLAVSKCHDERNAWKYFCGICWKVIKGENHA
jgi:CRISPR/Cas system Type II protein with McrA/HNH and RuvC-like nuclease domain